MIVACRGCAYRFEALGYRDAQCPVCHEVTPTVRVCPACSRPLSARRIADVTIDTCETCAGMFIDAIAIHRVLAEGQEARARAIVEAVAAGTAPTITPPVDATRRCPTCATAMTRTLAAGGSGVVLDVCRPHGTFFDGGELHKMLEFATHHAERARTDLTVPRTADYKSLTREQATNLLLAAGGILLAILLGLAH